MANTRVEIELQTDTRDDDDDDGCPICLEPLTSGHEIVTVCGHRFHCACMHEWHRMATPVWSATGRDGALVSTCPTCRTILRVTLLHGRTLGSVIRDRQRDAIDLCSSFAVVQASLLIGAFFALLIVFLLSVV
jgi:hypothetical protein